MVPWTFKGYDAATGKEKIQFNPPTNRFSISQLASRWQAQLGIRYSFN
jgi:hypothetical protein